MSVFDNVPQELTDLSQWVCCVNDSKIPLNARTGHPASASDPRTWSDFDTAVHGVTHEDADNIGFVFAENGGIIGIDLDEGVWDELGLMTPLCAEFISRCDSYTEKSRSGRGIHIYLRGKLPFKGRNNRHGVEIYQSNRFFIVTGNKVHGDGLREAQDAVEWVLKTHFADCERESTGVSRQTVYRPLWEKQKSGHIKFHPEYPPIHNGCRNLSLASIAGSMHTAGYAPRHILAELDRVNKMVCRPALEAYEVRQIVNSITKYKR